MRGHIATAVVLVCSCAGTPAGPGSLTNDPSTAGPTAASPTAPVKSDSCTGACSGLATPELSDAIRSAGSSTGRCFEQALGRDPKLGGKGRVEFRIADDGGLCRVDLQTDGITDQIMLACIRTAFESKRYPPPRDGCVVVTVPLSFTPRSGLAGAGDGGV